MNVSKVEFYAIFPWYFQMWCVRMFVFSFVFFSVGVKRLNLAELHTVISYLKSVLSVMSF